MYIKLCFIVGKEAGYGGDLFAGIDFELYRLATEGTTCHGCTDQ